MTEDTEVGVSESKVAGKRPTGRPRKYTPELAEKICRQVSMGNSLRRTLKNAEMPGLSTCMRWLSDQPGFRERYARARVQGVELHIDQIVDLADSATPEDAHVKRLQVDTRKWIASKIAPKLYGDRLAVDAQVESKQEDIDVVQLARMILFGLNIAAHEQERRDLENLPLLPAQVPEPTEPAATSTPSPADDDELRLAQREREQREADLLFGDEILRHTRQPGRSVIAQKPRWKK